MKTLVLFASKHGCTKTAAQQLAGQLQNVDLFDIAQKSFSLADYDTVIVGGSIYVGRIDKALTQYLTSNLATLLQKRIGLFVCCGLAEKAIEQLGVAFPKGLVQAAVVKGYFGYGFDHLSFAEKMICKVMKAPIGKTEIRTQDIASFARDIGQTA